MASATDPLTVADLLAALGPIPAHRVRSKPAPGTATERDVIEIEGREDRLCELYDGILVEKVMGFYEAYLATMIARLVGLYQVLLCILISTGGKWRKFIGF